MRWIALPLLPAVLLPAAACEEEAEPTVAPTIEAEATDTPALPEATDTPPPPEPTATSMPPEPMESPPPRLPPPPQAQCDPSYPDVCIPIGAADYDCVGGSGDGPSYIAGPIRVLPPDPHGLDRDRDGWGCE